MNRIYRSIWNESTATFVAASENARSGGRKTSGGGNAVVNGAAPCAQLALKLLSASVLLAFGSNLYALPTGGAVSAGSASIAGTAAKTTITQASQNVSINWQSFNIGASEAVQFVQPNSSSVALNRVLGPDPSSILGSLSANGRVFLVNPNGVLFGKGAQVNVGGLVASSLNISDADFMAGSYRFAGSSNAAILNQGTIKADGGYVALLGANVSNEGVISAQLGSVALAAGNAITLDVAGDGLLSVAVNQGAVNALIQNGGMIRADGGQVMLSGRSANALLDTVINMNGVIQANSLSSRNGVIRLEGGEAGVVAVSGALDASGTGAGQTGGTVTVTGQYVGLYGARINAAGDAGGGTVLVGGDYQGKNPAMQNASATYMSADASINADAITQGKGGKVVLWANDTTRAHGSISTRGGAQGGDGGLIETSGHFLDVADITIDAGAPNGAGGTWLLDPANVTIGAGTVGGSFNAGVFSPDSGVGVATVDAGTIQIALNGGTDVTITTANNGVSGPGVGDLTVSSALVWTTGRTLTLNADHDVIVSAAMTASTANSKMVLTATNDVKINAALVASGQNSQILLTAGNDVLATAAVTASEVNTLVRMTAGNNVTASGAAAITATGLGAVIDLAAGRNLSVVAVTANGGGAVNSISLRANTDVTANGALSAAGGNILLRSDSDGTGPGVIGGTVNFAGPGAVAASTTTTIRFNPNGYTNTAAEIAALGARVTAATPDIKAWVFPVGVDKPYDGLTTATLQFKNPLPADNPNVGNTVTLNGGTATFNTKDVGALKPVSFNGYTLGGGDLARFSLFSPVGVASGTGTTTANITVIPLTVTASDHAAKTYGSTFAFAGTEYTSTGLVNSEAIGNVVLASAGIPAVAPVGAYAITPSGAAANGNFLPTNYTITYVNGNLPVTPAPLTVQANNATKVYGQVFTPAASAFTLPVAPQNGETVGSVTELSPAGTPATAAVPGPHAIIPSNATGGTFTPSNYTITYLNGALTVTPAPLTVTASDATKVFGQTPTLTAFTTSALQNGETVGSVTETSPGIVATAVAPGPYPITPSSATGGTFTASNYAITYVNGALTVTALPVPAVVVTPGEGTPVAGTPIATSVVAQPDTSSGELPTVAALGGIPLLAGLIPGVNLAVLGTGVNMPPVQLALVPPQQPTSVGAVRDTPLDRAVAPPEARPEAPPTARVAPPFAPPTRNVVPVRPPKQDRN